MSGKPYSREENRDQDAKIRDRADFFTFSSNSQNVRVALSRSRLDEPTKAIQPDCQTHFDRRENNS